MISIGPIDYLSPEYDLSLDLRNQILRVPLGLYFHPKDLMQEYNMHHLAVFDSAHDLLACLILSPVDNQIMKMRQVAVKESCQGMGIGSQLVHYSEAYAASLGFKEMKLHARDTAIAFYESNAYRKVGKPFEEVGIKHYLMHKILR